MKAVKITKYGPPDVIQIQDVQKPCPNDNQILIRIKATAAADPDCAFRKGKPFISRFFTGLTRPQQIPGDVFAGTIEAVGKNVSLFQAGDDVYGSSGTSFGTNAQYIVLNQNEAIALKPKNISFEEAAAISEGSLTALPFLRDNGKIRKGHRILINGASGGVGVYAVQLAKSFDAHVTAVCGPANTEFIKALGADRVIDYTKGDFTKTDERYDMIFDAVGKSTFSKCKNALAPNGVYLTTVPSAGVMLSMIVTSKSKDKRAVFAATGLRKPAEKREDLLFLGSLIESGKLKAVIGRQFTLEQMADAHRYVETGHKRGSAAITIN